MDWIQGIQNALNYIEEHITENIDYGELAKTACSSSYHFQRVFGIMCGITLGDYVAHYTLRAKLRSTYEDIDACRFIDLYIQINLQILFHTVVIN